MGKKKSGKAPAGLNDERFSQIKSNPMFVGLKNSEKKVKMHHFHSCPEV